MNSMHGCEIKGEVAYYIEGETPARDLRGRLRQAWRVVRGKPIAFQQPVVLMGNYVREGGKLTITGIADLTLEHNVVMQKPASPTHSELFKRRTQ